MKSALQRFLLCIVAIAAMTVFFSRPTHSALSQQQRAQQTVYILVNVTPGPLSYHAEPKNEAISARFALRAKGSQASVDSEALDGMSALVAQSQGAVRVQAEVTPNPNATLLVTNQQNIVLTGTAGTTVTQSCVYTVTANAASIASWTIRQGLSADFSSQFPGKSLANNSYGQAATPQPTSTPFVVYPSNWTVMASSSHTQTYCVDLALDIPATTPGGAYSTNAVYTLYY